MKNSLFIPLLLCATACFAPPILHAQSPASGDASPEIYEWRIYTLAPDADAARLDAFFRDQLIPAYGRHGIEVGVFEPAESYPEFPSGARYLFMAWPDLETFRRVNRLVRQDAAFMEGAAGYFDASAPNPLYTNFETYLCEALDSRPRLIRPGTERGLFELRVYRSPNMEANERKIEMFEGGGEIEVFEQTGINAVCYARTLAGPRMPSLTYLTWYKDADTRRAAWAAFGAHPEWRRISRLPRYAHTATDNLIRLLLPLPYSQY
jgi:hypothetical protein